MDKNQKANLRSKIQTMNGKERWEHWRNQTLVNRTDSDISIRIEYYTLIKFVEKEYKGRMECIQNPYLHLISHCMELSYKEIIKQSIDCGMLNEDFSKIVHKHSLEKLLPSILEILKYIANSGACSNEEKNMFLNEIICANENIVAILKADTTIYRYSLSIDRKGNEKKKDTPFKEDYDSPNLLDIMDLFDKCYESLSYASFLLDDIIFPKYE